MSRLAGLAAVVLLAAAATAHAAPSAPVSLTDGQTRWFAAGELGPGATVACLVGGRTVHATVPSGAVSTGIDSWDSSGGGSVEISRRSDGAARVACGSAATVPPRPTPPFVIGQNGLALIRGTNHLDQIVRALGSPSSQHGCTASWRALGLRATFAGGSCAGDPALATATVTGPRWSTLDAARIGDPLAEVRWLQPDAKPVTAARWRLASARHADGRSTLYASIGRDGRVSALEFVAAG